MFVKRESRRSVEQVPIYLPSTAFNQFLTEEMLNFNTHDSRAAFEKMVGGLDNYDNHPVVAGARAENFNGQCDLLLFTGMVCRIPTTIHSWDSMSLTSYLAKSSYHFSSATGLQEVGLSPQSLKYKNDAVVNDVGIHIFKIAYIYI